MSLTLKEMWSCPDFGFYQRGELIRQFVPMDWDEAYELAELSWEDQPDYIKKFASYQPYAGRNFACPVCGSGLEWTHSETHGSIQKVSPNGAKSFRPIPLETKDVIVCTQNSLHELTQGLKESVMNFCP